MDPSQAKSLALLDIDCVEHMQGGANGPTIRLRGFINAQTGPTEPAAYAAAIRIPTTPTTKD